MHLTIYKDANILYVYDFACSTFIFWPSVA